jgi:hypothetical protein
VFMAYALIGYPLVGVLGGHALSEVPLFGVSPCATVTFFFGCCCGLSRQPRSTCC